MDEWLARPIYSNELLGSNPAQVEHVVRVSAEVLYLLLSRNAHLGGLETLYCPQRLNGD